MLGASLSLHQCLDRESSRPKTEIRELLRRKKPLTISVLYFRARAVMRDFAEGKVEMGCENSYFCLTQSESLSADLSGKSVGGQAMIC